jgi:hypothetical protein
VELHLYFPIHTFMMWTAVTLYFQDPSVIGRMILNWVLEKSNERLLTGYVWLRNGSNTGVLL